MSLLDKYLEEVRGNGEYYKMQNGNSKNLNSLKFKLKNLEKTSPSFKDLQTTMESVMKDQKLKLSAELSRLQSGFNNISKSISLVNNTDEAKGNIVTFYPSGYNIDGKLYSLLQKNIEGINTEDIDNCDHLMDKLFYKEMFENEKFKDLISVSGDYQDIKKSNDICFRSNFHWPAFDLAQLGIGGPSDISKTFGILLENNFYIEGTKPEILEKIFNDHTYLNNNLKLINKDEVDNTKENIFGEIKSDYLKFQDALFLDHDIWFTKDDLDNKGDSYVSAKKYQKLRSSPADATTPLNDVPFTDQGRYDTQDGLRYVKLQGDGTECVLMFARYGKMDNKLVSFKDDKSEKLFYNICTNLNDLADGASTTDADKRVNAEFLITTDNVLQGQTIPKDNQTAIGRESKQIGGKRKTQKRKLSGGQRDLFGFSTHRVAPRNTTNRPSGCGTTGDLNTLTNAFAVYGDRKLMDFGDTEKSEIFIQNMVKLLSEIKGKTKDELNGLIDRYANAFGGDKGLPLFYIFNDWGSRDNTNPKNFRDTPMQIKDMRYVLAVANISVNLGNMLRRTILTNMLIYYYTLKDIETKIRDGNTKNKNILINIISHLLQGMVAKYNTYTKMLTDVFGRIPTFNNKDNQDEGISEMEYFTGITFTNIDKNSGGLNRWKKSMKNVVNILSEEPIAYQEDVHGVKTIDFNRTFRRITKLLFELPMHYKNIYENNEQNAIDLGPKASEHLVESYKKLTLGGMPLFLPDKEFMVNYINVIRLSVDSAKKSKDTYLKRADILTEDIFSAVNPLKKKEIKENVSKYVFGLAQKFNLQRLIKQINGVDDERDLFEKKEVLAVYEKFIRVILERFCVRKDNFTKKYLKNLGNVEGTESRVGNLATSISKIKINTNINKKRRYVLDTEREELILEAKAMITSIYRGYLGGIIPYPVLRFISQKIHNIINDLDAHSTRVLLMNATQRKTQLSLMGYKNSMREDSYSRCLYNEILPPYNTTLWWEQKEALLNYLTAKDDHIIRFYSLCLVAKSKEERIDRRHTWDMWRYLWGWTKNKEKYELFKRKIVDFQLCLVDILSLARKGNFNQLNEDKFEIIRLDQKIFEDDKGKYKKRTETFFKKFRSDYQGKIQNDLTIDQLQFLQGEKQVTREYISATTISQIFDIDKISRENKEKKIIPMILIGNNLQTKLFAEGLKKINLQNLHTSSILNVISDKEGNISDDPDYIRRICYECLFSLPNTLTPTPINTLSKETNEELSKINDIYLSNFSLWEYTGTKVSGKSILRRLFSGLRGQITKRQIQDKINTYAQKAIKLNGNFNPYLIRILTGGGPEKKHQPMPFDYAGAGFSYDGYVPQIVKSYQNLGISIVPDIVKIDQKLPEISGSNKTDTKNRLNINFLNIKRSDSSGVGQYVSSIISRENAQKGFGWLLDISSVSEVRDKAGNVNIF